MFEGAYDFNQDISKWNVSNVTDMSEMFNSTLSFDQNINSWNVGKLTNMSYMFLSNSNFNQNISSWNISKVTTMKAMFENTKLSTRNYDNVLSSWKNKVHQEKLEFHAGSSNYCDSETDRDSLINIDKWIIADGGKLCE